MKPLKNSDCILSFHIGEDQKRMNEIESRKAASKQICCKQKFCKFKLCIPHRIATCLFSLSLTLHFAVSYHRHTTEKWQGVYVKDMLGKRRRKSKLIFWYERHIYETPKWIKISRRKRHKIQMYTKSAFKAPTQKSNTRKFHLGLMWWGVRHELFDNLKKFI